MGKRNLLFLLGLVLILLLAVSPILAAMGAGMYASSHGCVLHEGFINPCIVDGKDVGKSLYGIAMAGWFAIATVPIGLAAAAIMIVIWAVTAAAARKRAKQRAG